MKDLKNAIGYIRVSTEHQAHSDRFGIAVQKSQILSYADQNGYTIVDWKIDEIRGANEERPALNDILYGAVTNPPFEAVILFNNSCLAEDIKLYFYYLFILERKNITLLCVEEEFAQGCNSADSFRSILQFVAEQERRSIAIRTPKGRSMKASCGGYSGGRAPYGYKVDNGTLVINEEERPIVEYVFAQHGKGIPMLTIADHLNDLGYQTRKGTKFHDTSVRSILRNRRFYEGYYKYGKDMNWVKGVHEPLL